MLLNSFFFIQKNDDGVYRLQLNADHVIYKGHFPENPVTPGVVLIQMLTELMQQHTGKAVRLISIPSCKFSKTLNPFEYPFVNYSIKTTQSNNHIQVNAQVEEEGTLFCKISAVYE